MRIGPPIPPPTTTTTTTTTTTEPPIIIGLRRPGQVQPAQVHPAQVHPAQVQPAQVQPAQVQPARAVPAQAVDPVPNGFTRIEVVDRCDPTSSQVLAEVPTEEIGQPAVDFDGDVVAVPMASRVVRFDIGATIIQSDMPVDSIGDFSPYVAGTTSFELRDNSIDVSADGNVVVATLWNDDCDCSDLTVASWVAGATEIALVSSPDGDVDGESYSPSVSDDGSFVSFVSDQRLTGLSDDVAGPWVYVRERATPAFVLVSPVDEQARFSSISEDGSQVTFVHQRPQCAGTVPEPGCEDFPAPFLSVAYSSVPGFGAGFDVETINQSASGAIVGDHREPVISGSGRYVAWTTNGGGTLLGQPTFGDQYHAMLRERDASFRIDDLDFGTQTSGASLTRSTTVTNTGTSSILPTEMVTTSPAYVVTGGSCVVGEWIPPGATCTVDVRFTAPVADGAVNAQLVVREAGFEALETTAALTAQVTPPTTTPPPSTTTTTVAPPGPSVDPIVILSAAPNPLEFGLVAINIPTAVAEITIGNGGNVAGPIQLFVSGDHPGDFEIVSDSCRVAALAPGATCVVRVRMTATAGGARTAVLDVISGSATTRVTMIGEGRLAPQLAASPASVTERSTTTIVGQGFVPGEVVTVTVEPIGLVVTGLANGVGVFQTPLPVFGRLPLGSYELVVAERPSFYDEVRATLVVVLGTYQPQGPTSAIFRENMLVVRGN